MDGVVSKAFDRGLVRYKTLAEGAEVCDFRYKAGRETFLYPLRDGWPPRFLNVETQHKRYRTKQKLTPNRKAFCAGVMRG
jgi:hypothetical protein